MTELYVVKRGKHYSQVETAYVSESKKKCEEWIEKHILPGEHMYIATAHEVVIDDNLPEYEQIGGMQNELI